MDDSLKDEEFVQLSGTVERITYRNKENGYTVAVVQGDKEKVTVVGTLPFITDGEVISFSGTYIIHPTYGKQFSVKTFEHTVPENAAAILHYLSSGIIKGIGPVTANRIVKKFGNDTLDIIQNHPEELIAIQGISAEKAKAISAEYNKQFSVRDIMLMLSPYQITPERCVKIYRQLGPNATSVIKDNPYVLCRQGIDFSFEKAESIAADLGISSDNEMRLAAGIEYIVRSNLSNGHTCLPKKKLIDVGVRLLNSDKFRLSDICTGMVDEMILRSKTINGCEYLALPEYYCAEEYIAARMFTAVRNFSTPIPVDDLEIDYVENKLGISFEKHQREAVKSAFSDGLLILTGGPGTGKTTTLNAIIELFERREMSITLAAPTGRAAKRMTELTGREAKTIHRLLEVEWSSDDEQRFSRNERNPLECDVIIIDEASMLDSLLFEGLLRALRITCRIILVGDVDQLPSISAGNVLNDLLYDEKFKSIRLTNIFRQAKQSSIIVNAHAIISGDEPDFSNKGNDCFIMRRSSDYDVCNTVLELCLERLPSAYGFDNLKDIQVICPSRKLTTGTLNLNNLLQQCLNPNIHKPQINYKGIAYREGDKVMQIKNNYDIEWQREGGETGYGVFNGDVGIITLLDKKTGIIKVRFDDRIAIYSNEQIGELELAYAVTVHKSQGSEFNCVILPLFNVPEKLQFRNLLYTAVTRAKKLLIIVGNEQVYRNMAMNDRKTLRYTLLKEFLNENFKSDI